MSMTVILSVMPFYFINERSYFIGDTTMIKRLKYTYKWFTPYTTFTNHPIPSDFMVMPILVSTYQVQSKTNSVVPVTVEFTTSVRFGRQGIIVEYMDTALVKIKHIDFIMKYQHHGFKDAFYNILKKNNGGILDDTAISQLTLYFNDMEFKQHRMAKYTGSVLIGGI